MTAIGGNARIPESFLFLPPFLLPPMSAFYVQHQGPPLASSTSKIRQEGFQIPNSSPSLNAPPSPNTPFDPQNVFFHGSHIFPNAFKKFNDSNSLDFSETLASMMATDPPEDHNRQLHNPRHHHTPASSVDFSTPQPQSQNQQPQHLFDISSFPSHLNNFRGTPDSGLGTESPVQHNFFGDPPLNHAVADYRHHSYNSTAHPPILPHLNNIRTASPSSSDLAYPSSPFSPPGNRTPSTVVHSQSRSRSRSRTATSAVRPPPTAGSSSGVAGANPSPGMAIVIPDIHSPPPPSPATSWMFSPSSQQTTFSLPDPTGGGFPPPFAPSQSLPMSGLVGDDKSGAQNGKDDAASKQAALLNEKRRRRRESHNAVERRRRDNINEKITELSTLIPDCLLVDQAGGPTGGSSTIAPFSSEFGGELNGDGPQALPAAGSGSGNQDEEGSLGGAALKANKGIILRKSVDYIRFASNVSGVSNLVTLIGAPRYLQQLVRAQSTRNRELEEELQHYRSRSSPPQNRPIDGFSHHNGNGMMQLSSDSPGSSNQFSLASHYLDFGALGTGAGNEDGFDANLGTLSVKEENSPHTHGNSSQSAEFNGHSPLPQTSGRRQSTSQSQLDSRSQMDGSPSAGGSGSNGSDLDEDDDGEAEEERGRNKVRSQARFQQHHPSTFGDFDVSALSEGDDESGGIRMDER
ncbi:hypothetical protein BS47DRAFT_1395261 [Hydnum rufescens UP504]|uniref:BHLH domain-containing protein n=1 Tax=Hydnum rufescens UP504 TaxID=1448309 RepID=A0A9P6ASR1_9AGAM|nr:hypothetical protein BS47DRAFT_1395261 [Hydnum rufescens UP504]